MSSSSSNNAADNANVVLCFPRHLHGPLLSALEQRATENNKKKKGEKGECSGPPFVCSLDEATGEASVLATRDLGAGELFVLAPVVAGARSRLAALAAGGEGDRGRDDDDDDCGDEDAAIRSAMREVVVEALLAGREEEEREEERRRRQRRESKNDDDNDKVDDEEKQSQQRRDEASDDRRERRRRQEEGNDEASDPLLGNLWRWLIPAGVGACKGSGGRPDARWLLAPREISWLRHRGVESSTSSSEPANNARVALLTLDDDDDDDSDDDSAEKKGEEEREEREEEEEERLLLVLWLERGVARGEEITTDWSFEEPSPASKGSLRRAASLVARLKEQRWAGGAGGADGAEVRRALAAAVSGAARANELGRASSSSSAAARRPASTLPLPSFPSGDGKRVLVWTDYPIFAEWLDAREKMERDEEVETKKFRCCFRRVAERSSADVVLTRLPLRSFFDVDGIDRGDNSSNQICNQFPFEGALVRKDLLPSTLRCWAGDDGKSETNPSSSSSCSSAVVSWPPSPDSGLHPPFFPPTYDLSTELHHLLEAAAAAKEEEKDGDNSISSSSSSSSSYWVLKPATASRSLGLSVTSSLATIAAFAMRSCAGGDRVAQRYIEKPCLTLDNKKFDLRVLVVVRSFERENRPSASMYTRYHARVAPARYSPPPRKGKKTTLNEKNGGGATTAAAAADDEENNNSSSSRTRGLIDQAIFGTVACYNARGNEEDAATKKKEEDHGNSFLSRDQVDATLSARGLDPIAVESAIASLARQVVVAASGVIGGPWPRSRAIYGLDVVLDEAEKTTVCFSTKNDDVKVKKEELIPTPRLLEVNFAPDLEFAADFNPDLPGQLLREMMVMAEGEDEREEGDGLFVTLL